MTFSSDYKNGPGTRQDEPMNPDAKDKWVKALESGEYAQTHEGGLRDRDDKFCCLGVLCEVAVAEGVIPAPEPPAEHGSPEDKDGRDTKWYVYLSNDGDRDTAFLPEVVAEWAGIKTGNGEIPGQGDSENPSLTTMNDSGWSFSEIAAVIREKF